MMPPGLERLGKAVEAVIDSPEPGPHRCLAFFLGLLAVEYGGLTALRGALYRHRLMTTRRLTCPVVSVGNITVGGTGKTPLAISLARRFRDRGLRPLVISRGYRGRAERTGGVVSDGRSLRMGPREAGDEPFMMAAALSRVPVVVGGDRFAAGGLAQSAFDPGVIVLDDAFQHIQLHRDINLVVMDRDNPLGNGRLLPRGPLREPVSALARADAFILTRGGEPGGQADLPAWSPRLAGNRPVFSTVSSLQIRLAAGIDRRGAGAPVPAFAVMAARDLRGRRVAAFSGIARNHRFVAGLHRFGIDLAAHLSFPDHHWYTDADLRRIQRTARESRAEMVATTEKDWVRVFRRIDWPMPVVVVSVEIGFSRGGRALDRFVDQRLGRAGKKEGR
jgi:tetraacyldisaccharide 4'-kinase